VSLRVEGDLREVPPGVDLSAYRLIQEALTNVIKHAGPARAVVSITCSDREVTVVVSDDGLGAQASATAGYGLAGIRERVAVIGGEVQTGAGHGCGYVLRARLPYEFRP
jgi:signal transduction histidine kinase